MNKLTKITIIIILAIIVIFVITQYTQKYMPLSEKPFCSIDVAGSDMNIHCFNNKEALVQHMSHCFNNDFVHTCHAIYNDVIITKGACAYTTHYEDVCHLVKPSINFDLI